MDVRENPLTQIHFFTGKGGVGKSTHAMAHAQNLAKQGHKTLLLELGAHSFYRWVLPKAPEHQPYTFKKNLSVAKWDGIECLREFGIHMVKSAKLVDLFFQNRVAQSLVRSAPGLTELALLGKITSGPPRNIGPKIDFEHIVVDCFSTGHFLALMRAPFGLAESVRRGPMGVETRAIIEVLKSAASKYYFVCNTEELPVIETLELLNEFKKMNLGQPQIILNSCWAGDEKSSSAFGHFSKIQRVQTLKAEKALSAVSEVQKFNRIPAPDFMSVVEGFNEQ